MHKNSFEHSYQFWNQGEGNKAFADTDGYVMIGSFDGYNYTLLNVSKLIETYPCCCVYRHRLVYDRNSQKILDSL